MDSPKSATPPPPIEKDSVRSVSSSRQRPALPPKERERRRSRGSTFQLVSANPELLAPSGGISKRRTTRRHPNVIINQLASIKHWFVESAKRAKSPGLKSDASANRSPQTKSAGELRQAPRNSDVRGGSDATTITPHQSRGTMPTPRSRYAAHRSSLSPAPLTPHSSSYRRSSAGLRGRKSTSSSVSSIRSIHHVHTHSKASSTSSTSNSVVSSAMNPKPLPIARSPHSSVKVLPATPTSSAFPSNVRLVRTTPPPISIASTYDETAFSGAMASPGLVFAKRKKTPFRGPMLHINSGTNGASSSRSREASVGSRSTSLPRQRSGQTIAEEDEDEVEEVEAFSLVAPGDVVEQVVEEGED